MDAITRLRALKFDVIVSTELKQDAAVCAVLGTAVEYRNPHYAHERGFSEARETSEAKGAEILADIASVCNELERLLAASSTD